MKLNYYSHHFAYEILQYPIYHDVFKEIESVCLKCPLPVYKNKSETQKDKDVIQQLLNTYIDLQFRTLGWTSQPLVSNDSSKDKLKADFSKTFKISNNFSNKKDFKVIIEVEFGNNASYYRDLYKFLLAYSQGSADLCILILPSSNISKRIDSGVIDYEKPLRELIDARLNFPIPILIIGLDEDENNIWDTKAQIGNYIDKVKKLDDWRKLYVQSYIKYVDKTRKFPFFLNASYENIVALAKNYQNTLDKNSKKIEKLNKEIYNLKDNDDKKSLNHLSNKKQEIQTLQNEIEISQNNYNNLLEKDNFIDTNK